MPRANAGDVKRWLQDHDTGVVDEAPPVQNEWYEAFHEEDVRHIWCTVLQDNDEVAALGVEIRWTIDGNVYDLAIGAAAGTLYYIYRDAPSIADPLAELAFDTVAVNAGRHVDKRGLDYKVEVRLTGVPGTNQVLESNNVYETLEQT